MKNLGRQRGEEFCSAPGIEWGWTLGTNFADSTRIFGLVAFSAQFPVSKETLNYLAKFWWGLWSLSQFLLACYYERLCWSGRNAVGFAGGSWWESLLYWMAICIICRQELLERMWSINKSMPQTHFANKHALMDTYTEFYTALFDLLVEFIPNFRWDYGFHITHKTCVLQNAGSSWSSIVMNVSWTRISSDGKVW